MNCKHEKLNKLHEEYGKKYVGLKALCVDCGYMVDLTTMKTLEKYRRGNQEEDEVESNPVEFALNVIALVTIDSLMLKGIRDPLHMRIDPLYVRINNELSARIEKELKDESVP